MKRRHLTSISSLLQITSISSRLHFDVGTLALQTGSTYECSAGDLESMEDNENSITQIEYNVS